MSVFNLQQKIKYLLKKHKVVILKTNSSDWQEVFVKGLADGRSVVDVSDPMLRERAMWNPEEFAYNLPKPVLLLNLQYVPKLLACLVNEDVAHGSYLCVVGQDYYIMEESCNFSDVAFLKLPLCVEDREPFYPCTDFLKELSKAGKSTNVMGNIIQGKLSAKEFASVDEKDRFLGSYLRKLLQCAIKDLTTVSDDMRFYRFLCAVATSTGSAVNYANLGNTADISSPTAKQWMAFLEGAGVVHLLWPIEHESLKRVAKGPKVYFVDTGLAAYLLRINNEEDLAKSTYFTALFETYVVNTIRESYLENGLEAKLTYFRDSNAKEISVLLRYGDVLYPIEIKKEQTSITKLRKKFKLISGVEEDGLHIGNGCVVALGKNVEQLAEDLWQIGAGCL